MSLILIMVFTHLLVGGAGWFFGHRQGKRGLPIVSEHPRL